MILSAMLVSALLSFDRTPLTPEQIAPNMTAYTKALSLKEWQHYRRLGRLFEISTGWYIPCSAFTANSVGVPTINPWCQNL